MFLFVHESERQWFSSFCVPLLLTSYLKQLEDKGYNSKRSLNPNRRQRRFTDEGHMDVGAKEESLSKILQRLHIYGTIWYLNILRALFGESQCCSVHHSLFSSPLASLLSFNSLPHIFLPFLLSLSISLFSAGSFRGQSPRWRVGNLCLHLCFSCGRSSEQPPWLAEWSQTRAWICNSKEANMLFCLSHIPQGHSAYQVSCWCQTQPPVICVFS